MVGAGGRVVLRRGKPAEEEEDDEYVVDADEEEEVEEEEYVAAACSDEDAAEEDGGDDESDADFDADEESEDEEFEIEAPRPKKRPPRARVRRGRRRAVKPAEGEDSDDADFDVEDEGFEIDTPRPKRARSRGRKAKAENDSDADFVEEEELEVETPRPKRPASKVRSSRGRNWKQDDESDADFDGEEEEEEEMEEDQEGDEDFAAEAPQPKRPANGLRSRGRNLKDSDADFDGQEEEDFAVEAPQLRRPANGLRSRGRNRKQDDDSDADFDGQEEDFAVKAPQPRRPANGLRSRGRNRKQDYKSDADLNGEEEEEEEEEQMEDQAGDEDFEIEAPQPEQKQDNDSDVDLSGEEEEDQEGDEDFEVEAPQPKCPAHKVRSRGQKQDSDSDVDLNGEEEEVDEEEEDFEIEMLQPERPEKVRGQVRNRKPAGSRRRRHEDDDDYEEESEDEDEDFDPEVDGEEDDEEEETEEEDEDLGDYAPIRATKVKAKNHLVQQKPVAGRQHRKRSSGSRVSKGKRRKGTSAHRRRRKRWVVDNYEDEEEEEDEDDDFVVKDDVEEEEDYRPRKKAKIGRKTRDGLTEPVAVGESWPSVESDTSEFEFVTSDEEHSVKEAPTTEPARIKRKKGRRKRGSRSDSSSDSDYVISEEELKDLGLPRPLETVPQLPPHPTRRTVVPRGIDGKGKEPEETLKQICGICLSEEQRATIQGVLNCCSHYFCFACIMEWSKVESRCPLCKRRFNTITKSSVPDLGLGSRNVAIRVEKRDQVYQPTEDEMRRWLDPYENVVCIECNQGGDDNLMLLCDICDSSAHTFCVGLGREVPEGNWYCGGCRSSVEGPSYAQTEDRVVHHGENNMNTADSSSGSVGRALSSGIFQRPPPLNIQPSLQGFDLNLSPIETPDEDKRAESHISAEPVSTPTGRHATVDRRRALNRRIRILLFRPRTATNPWQNGVQHDSIIPGTEQNNQNTCPSTEVSPSCSSADFMQSQQSSSPFVQSSSNLTHCTYGGGSNFREIANAKDQLIPIVKRSIKHIYAQSPLDQTSFMNVARRATNTVLALSGIAHNRDRVVATPFPFPSHCRHACDGREPAFLMRTVCSSCFNSFVGDVVSHIANMFS
ncbi:uncharacterized protein LOC100840975 isoform X2 [Brachypodium distachyon]|nr:uncharacterized protein LOC100840975 isoform X2 [Brachypodium distachyon]|eukprot:XP_024312485.1 uncharacterized protein LOC100840975 isoform X2 [Brachypodium distachyon]